MLVLVESRKNPNVIITTPSTRHMPFFSTDSLRSFTMQKRSIAITTTTVIITEGLRILLTPPLSGITTY